jgi:molybdopterin molybdotransferase
VPAAIGRLGMQTHFDRLAVKPGRPTTFATAPGWILLALPGNPVAVFLMFHLLVLRAVAHLYGLEWEPRIVRMPLRSKAKRENGERMEYAPARLVSGGAVELLECHGSGHQAALLEADGFAILPAGTTEYPAGGEVGFMPTGAGWGDA